jgi:hypothetical protein
MIQMEKNMGKRLDDMKADFLAVSARVRSLEDKVTNFRKTLTECENSCQGVSNLFDQADSRSLFSQFSDWDWYRPVKTRLFFILRHCKSSTLHFRSWMSAVRVLIWPDSVTGCITGWTTGFSSSFLILVSWWIMFLQNSLRKVGKSLKRLMITPYSVWSLKSSQRSTIEWYRWRKIWENVSSNLLRTADFTTCVQSPTSYYTVVRSFLQ